MPRYYTHYWKNATCDMYLSRQREGTPVLHATSGAFRDRGVMRGDKVYPVTVYDGRLYLIGRINVAEIISREEALARLGGDVWDGDTVIVALTEGATPMRLRREVPLSITERLRFLSGSDTLALTFDSPGHLDQQTLRGVRQLTDASAAALDAIIKQTDGSRYA